MIVPKCTGQGFSTRPSVATTSPHTFSICRGKVPNQAAALQELEIVSKIINHLIRKGDTLAVLSRPARLAGEDDGSYLQRMQAERVLQLHDNYAPDDE